MSNRSWNRLQLNLSAVGEGCGCIPVPPSQPNAEDYRARVRQAVAEHMKRVRGGKR